MAQAHSKRVWHLSRRDERPCVLSDEELLLLAELGHLRADDLLWSSGFDGYRTVRSLLGHVTVPPLPSSISLSQRPKQISVKRGANRRIKLVELAGLLVAVVLVGVLGIAMHKSLATDPEPALQYSASTELYSAATEFPSASTESHPASTEPQQPKSEPATANAVSPSKSTGRAELEQGGIIVRTVRVVSIDMPQPSDASALVPNPASEGPSNSVPLPIKKPARPIQSLNTAGKVRAGSADSGRISQAPVPKPMGFGPFGFNNSEN